MNTKLYDSLLNLIEASSIDMENLYNYYKNQKNTVVNEKPEDEMPELLSDNEEETKVVKPDLTKKKSWADYDTDDEEDFPLSFSKTINKDDEKKKEAIKKDVEERKKVVENTFYDNFATVVKKGTKHEDSKNKETFPATKNEKKMTNGSKHSSDSEPKFSDDDVGFETVEKKTRKKSNNLPIIRTGAEFQKMCNERKRPGVDYIIADDGHCEHTHEGTLCKNIRRAPICYKIHMQRCTDGEYCKRGEKCTFVHVWDMNDDVAVENFNYTMEEYNKIKPDKKVRM